MKNVWRYIVVLCALIACARTASAQYYSWGADPTYMRWNKLKGDKINIIYPDTARTIGYKMMGRIPDIFFSSIDSPTFNMTRKGVVAYPLPKQIMLPAVGGDFLRPERSQAAGPRWSRQ